LKCFKLATAKRTSAESFFLLYVNIVFFILDSAFVGYPVMLEKYENDENYEKDEKIP